MADLFASYLFFARYLIFIIYSYHSASTGFRVAAFQLCQLTSPLNPPKGDFCDSAYLLLYSYLKLSTGFLVAAFHD